MISYRKSIVNNVTTHLRLFINFILNSLFSIVSVTENVYIKCNKLLLHAHHNCKHLLKSESEISRMHCKNVSAINAFA